MREFGNAKIGGLQPWSLGVESEKLTHHSTTEETMVKTLFVIGIVIITIVLRFLKYILSTVLKIEHEALGCSVMG